MNASDFFGSAGKSAVAVSEYYDARARQFDIGCAKRILRTCPSLKGITNSQQLTQGEVYNQPITLKMLDEWANLPVRLVARPLEARHIDATDRPKWDKGFHELEPVDVLNFREFKKTQFYRAWRDAKEGVERDSRPLGVMFRCRNSVYVLHDGVSGGPNHVQILTDDGVRLRIETLESLVDPSANGA